MKLLAIILVAATLVLACPSELTAQEVRLWGGPPDRTLLYHRMLEDEGHTWIYDPDSGRWLVWEDPREPWSKFDQPFFYQHPRAI